jgi:acyl-CoA dehydrogenase
MACGGDSGPNRTLRTAVTVRQAGESWQLDGVAPLVMGGTHAHRYIVVAQREDSSLAMLDVPANSVGLTVHAYQLQDGRGAADLQLTSVMLPRDALLASHDHAVDAGEHALSFATLALCAESIGAMRQALGITVEYLRTRKQFGRALADQPVLQHRVVDHYRAWHGARHLVSRATQGWGTESSAERTRRISAAKFMSGKVGRAIAMDMLQLHGAIGLQDETPISHYSKRLLANDLLGRFAATFDTVRT